MALPPRSLARVRRVRLERVEPERFRVHVDEYPVGRTFGSEDEALGAASAAAIRLDAIALALLRRIRDRSSRKQH